MVTRFQKNVYEVCSRVPKGKVTTYREIAHVLGTKAYRAVGSALNNNPYAPRVPCHRVVNSDGRVGGFASGAHLKIHLLKQEGVTITDGKVKQFKRRLKKFNR